MAIETKGGLAGMLSQLSTTVHTNSINSLDQEQKKVYETAYDVLLEAHADVKEYFSLDERLACQPLVGLERSFYKGLEALKVNPQSIDSKQLVEIKNLAVKYLVERKKDHMMCHRDLY